MKQDIVSQEGFDLKKRVRREESREDKQQAFMQELCCSVCLCKYTFHNEAGRFPDAALPHQ